MVVHNEAESRFELGLEGEMAVLEYRRTPDSIIFTHTGVPPQFEGRGYGSQLARAALDYAVEAGLKVVPVCGFIGRYIRRNPEYLDSVVESYRGAVPSCQIRR
jgi:uncharacterized protein